MARGEKVWLNGKLVPESESRISLFTHALHYGTGAFEGIRCYKQKSGKGAIFRLQEHSLRLVESLKILGLKSPFDANEIADACVKTVKANGFRECYIRPIAFIADGPLGVFPGENPPVSLAILVWEWGSYLGKGRDEGARLKISSYVRPHVNSIMTKGKICGQYVNSVLAKSEAIALGFVEALLLDPEGYLTEGSGENLFVVRDGKVRTTPLNSILNGITRNTVLAYFESKGIPVSEQRFTRDDLICSDEIFLTGTAAEISPVSQIDIHKIGDGKPGLITKNLQKDYQALVRGEKNYSFSKGWLTSV